MVKSPSWEWFAGCLTRDRASSLPIVFVGICDDRQSSFLRGAAEAPPHIRASYHARCYNSSCESGVDLAHSILDGGDLYPAETREAAYRSYRSAIRGFLGEQKVPFVAGGDHAVSVPVVDAFAAYPDPIHFVQIDAHPDLYSEYEGNPYSHACVAARVLEMIHVRSVTCLGVRTFNPEQRAVLEKSTAPYFEISARECSGVVPPLDHIGPGEPVYLSVDLDAFDPAFAPGVSHPVPGGLTPRQVLNLFDSPVWRLVGMDVVEANPARDEHDRTCILAGRLLHEGMGLARRQLGGS